MRAGRRSVAVAALGFAPLACAVYDGGALGGQQAGDASTTGGGGASSGSAGPGATQTGGASSTAGTSSRPSAGSANLGGTDPVSSAGSSGNAGGPQPNSGGENSAEAGAAGNGGESGAGNTASAGSAGSGGSSGASAGGTTGTSGASGTPGTSGASGTGGSAGTSGAAGTSGNAGSGGAPAGPLCSDHPLTLRSTWVASASSSDSAAGDTPSHLLDGKTTRWTTGKAQSGDEWLQIDFGATVTLNHVNLQQGTDTNDYPRSFALIVSDTAKDLSGSVRLSGSGKSGVSTAILLPALASGRYLLIEQTGSSLSWWSAEELEVSCAD